MSGRSTIKPVRWILWINELTLYSKIDTNRIPYNFKIISVNDCSEELSELESRNVEFGYFNYVEEDESDCRCEQIKRVINIINNSLKYMDKQKGKNQSASERRRRFYAN